ncbi:MAG TPA: arabinofuranosidase catalytic domain-containing protein, partial [Polyangiaceae bacterium]
AATGGSVAAGGSNGGGTTKATGGSGASGGQTAQPTGGSTATGGGSNASITGPCDIYAAASPATPCIAAYSVTRRINSKYTGPLYSVRKGGTATGTGGTVTEITATADGFADGAAHDAACGTSGCTFAVLFDQSGKGNDLKVAPAGCYEGTAKEADYESNALKKSITISGHKVYALYTTPHEGYRNNAGSGVPKGSEAQGIYMLADGTRTGSAAGTACCFDFGNASTNNCNQGTMNAIYFGTGYWGKGTGSGPWFMADLEGGVWAGGTGASNAVNNNLPSSTVPFAFGVLSTNSSSYAIRVGNGAPTGGALTTAYDGGLPKSLSHPGGIILGIGGDNSNSSQGTFFEGAMTAGKPSAATDAVILENIQAAKYGQ